VTKANETIRLAGLARRGMAIVIDAAIITGLHTLVLLPFVGLPFGARLVHRVSGVRGGLLSALAYCAIAAWYVLFTMGRRGRFNGQTVGKQLMGIKVVRDDHRPLSHGYILVREVVLKWLLVSLEVVSGVAVRLALLIPLGAFAAVNFLWPLVDRSNRALHDRMLKTRVIHAESGWAYVERLDRRRLPLVVAGLTCAALVVLAGLALDYVVRPGHRAGAHSRVAKPRPHERARRT
jgi:uncharacterized RDD family membrane protein YckC